MKIFDTIANVVSGLMTGRDKVSHDRWVLSAIDREQADAAYRGDWVARKVIDVPPQDMCREWRDWQAENDEIEKIEREEARHNIRAKVMRALRLARLYGGAGLYLGVRGQDPAQPLDIEGVRAGSLDYVHVLHRWQLNVTELDRDPASPFYGEPSRYMLSSTGRGAVDIHPSRVVRLLGNELPDIDTNPDGWGESVLQSVGDAVRHAGITAGNIASLVHEAKIDVIKVPGLMSLAGSDTDRDALLRRFTLASVAKANNGMLLLDGEEEWDRKQMQFSQLPELLTIYLQLAAGAADIPVTRLLGQSPAGMNSTGEHDTRNYYDRIAADQEMTLRPALERLDEVLIRSALGTRPPELHYVWAPLWQLSETERAEAEFKRAQTTKVYLDTGLIPDEALAQAVQNRLIEDGTYPGLEAALEEFGSEPVDREAERMQLEAELRAQGQAAREGEGEQGSGRPFGDAGFDPAQPRDPTGRWTRSASTNFVVQSIKGDGSQTRVFAVGVIENVDAIKAHTAIDVTGFVRVLDSANLRHTWLRHANQIVESARNPPQVAITEQDLSLISEIVRSGRIISARMRKQRPTVLYQMRYKGHVYEYVEEIRTGAKQMAFKTMWKFKE